MLVSVALSCGTRHEEMQLRKAQRSAGSRLLRASGGAARRNAAHPQAGAWRSMSAAAAALRGSAQPLALHHARG
jgi:hypothetical protein